MYDLATNILLLLIMNINGVYVLGLVEAINIATLGMAYLDSPNRYVLYALTKL
jgi:hypothetical protein